MATPAPASSPPATTTPSPPPTASSTPPPAPATTTPPPSSSTTPSAPPPSSPPSPPASTTPLPTASIPPPSDPASSPPSAPASTPPPSVSASAPPPSTPETTPPSTPAITPPASSSPSPPSSRSQSPPSLSPPSVSPPSPPSSGSTPAAKSPPPPSSSGGKTTPLTPSSSTPSSGSSSGSDSGSSSGSSSGGGNGSSLPTGLIAGVAIGVVAIIVILGLACFFCTRKKKRRNEYGGEGYYVPPPPPHHAPAGPKGITLGFSKSQFTYEELAMATDGFSDANLLGQGGFGYVHKGVLPNGKEVAVKSLKAGSGQGEREFQAEVEIMSQVHHRHLVSLVGYCITGSQRLLVYEFVPNKTLEFHLHGRPKIIHRDIKAANVLLDHNFEAKVADFGLAKLCSDANTHITTRVMGTFGYLAPEYASSGKLREKSDVFSFGVMLLELITGRRPVCTTGSYMEDSLVEWARPLLTRALEENNFDSLVDPRLENNYNPSEMSRMVAYAAACVRRPAQDRPRMSQVVRALEGEASLFDLNGGVKPGHRSTHSSLGSTGNDSSGHYREDTEGSSRQMPLPSQDYGTSEYGGTASEAGVQGRMHHLQRTPAQNVF